MAKSKLSVKKSRQVFSERPMTAHEYDKIADHKLPEYVRCVKCRKPPLDNNWLKVDPRDLSGRTMIHMFCIDQDLKTTLTGQSQGRG